LLILASRNTNEITKLGSGNIFKEKYVFKIKTDVNDENILWLSGSGGFCKMDKKTLDTIWYRPKDINKALKSNNITHFIQDQDGGLYFVSGGNLCLFESTNVKIRIVDPSFKIRGSVHSLALSDHKVWVATTTNLYWRIPLICSSRVSIFIRPRSFPIRNISRYFVGL